jgi:hypothetical protein
MSETLAKRPGTPRSSEPARQPEATPGEGAGTQQPALLGLARGTGGTPTEQPVRRWPWSKKKPAEEKPIEIGAPTGGRAMTKQEQGGALSAKEVIALKGQQDAEEEFDRLLSMDVAAEETAEQKERQERLANLNPALPKRVADSRVIPAGVTIWEVVDVPAPAKKKGKKGKKGKQDEMVQEEKAFPLVADFTLDVAALTPIPGRNGFLRFVADGDTFIVAEASLQKAEYVDEDAPVFAHDAKGNLVLPTADDVKQGRLGDCYLEAALASLADADPQAIVDMISDYGKNVGVRLHDVTTTKNKTTFSPRIVRVAKSRVRQGGELALDQGALWVGMIEKAYAAGKFAGTSEDEATSKSKALASFDSIDGGQARHAWEVLTGKPAAYVGMEDYAATGATGKGLPWGDAEIKEFDTVAKVKGGSYSGLASFKAFGKDPKKVDAWMAWLKKSGNQAIDEFFAKMQAMGSGDLAKVVRIEDLEALFAEAKLPTNLVAPMVTYLEGYFPGKRGTGRYTAAQLKLWNKLWDDKVAGKMIVANTREKIAKGPTDVGHSGGEAKAKGLAGGHAYTVLELFISDGVKVVKMRNPWGKYGRAYGWEDLAPAGGQTPSAPGGQSGNGATKPGAKPAPQKRKLVTEVEEDGGGITLVELSDLTKRFRWFDVQ